MQCDTMWPLLRLTYNLALPHANQKSTEQGWAFSLAARGFCFLYLNP